DRSLDRIWDDSPATDGPPWTDRSYIPGGGAPCKTILGDTGVVKVPGVLSRRAWTATNGEDVEPISEPKRGRYLTRPHARAARSRDSSSHRKNISSKGPVDQGRPHSPARQHVCWPVLKRLSAAPPGPSISPRVVNRGYALYRVP